MSKQPDYITRAKKKYRDSTVRFSITVNPRTEPLIIERINSQPSKSGYLKRLVIEDIRNEKG